MKCHAKVDEDTVNSYFNELQNTFEKIGNYCYLFFLVWQFKLLFQKEKRNSYIATPANNDLILMYENAEIASRVSWVGFLKSFLFPRIFYRI